MERGKRDRDHHKSKREDRVEVTVMAKSEN